MSTNWPIFINPLALETRGLVGNESANSLEKVIDRFGIETSGFVWNLWYNLTPYPNTVWNNVDPVITTIWTNVDNPPR